MKNFPERLVVHAKDVMVIAGIGERGAQRLLEKTRKRYNRLPRSYVSIQDFCGFTGFNEEMVRVFLK